VIVFVVRVVQLVVDFEVEDADSFNVVLDIGFEEVFVAGLLELLDVESFDDVLVVAFADDLVEVLVCEEVDIVGDLKVLVVE